MSTVLQPILVPANGEPDIVLLTDPKSPDELFVFLGMALPALNHLPSRARL